MRTITLLNEKGGVGKTTLATTLAAGLAVRGAKVVLVDADAQGHASLAFGDEKAPGLYDLLVRRGKWRDVLVQISPKRYDPQPEQAKGAIALIPSNIETRNIANSMSDGFYLGKRLQGLGEVFDYAIIDTSPTPSLLHTMIYMATDFIIYPSMLESWSFDGLNESMAHLRDFNSHVQMRGMRDPVIEAGIVPNLVEMRTLEHRENHDLLRSNFGDLVWTPIDKRTIWREASARGISVFAYMPESAEATSGWKLCEHMTGVLDVTA